MLGASSHEKRVAGVALLLLAGAFIGLRCYQKRLGVSCRSGDECNSHMCLVLPGDGEEGICSRECEHDQECPEDWKCVPAGEGDDDAVCLPALQIDLKSEEPR